MDSKIIQTVSQEVYRRFPDLNGRLPRVLPSRPAKARSGLRFLGHPDRYVFVYQGRKTTSTGKPLPYALRVLVDGKGKVLKITISH